jgi:amino acid adenylation domain-containing protein
MEPTQHNVCIFPTSFGQQRLWFLSRLDPVNSFYNILVSFRMRGRCDVAALVRSLNEIVRRHEALRTTFEVVAGEPVQKIAPALNLEVPVIDLGELDEAKREAEAQRLAAEEGEIPFDLARGPLLRAKVLRLAEADLVLLLTIHHIVSDGWSMGVLYEELTALYAAFSRGRPSPLPELPIQYADFTVWQRELLQGEVLQQLLDYWGNHLRGAPAFLELPTDRPRPAIQTFRGSSHSFRLPPSLQQAVGVLSRQERATPFMTLLSAFGVLLSRYARQDDVVIGAPIANRTRTELEGLIGFFVNNLALHLDLGGEPTFRELLGRVREVTLGAYAHQDLPFERLVEELSPQRDLSHSPVFQVMFVMQNMPVVEVGGTADDDDVFTDGPLPAEQWTAKFDLTLFMTESPQGLWSTLEYNSDLFDAGTIERMAEHFQVLLAAAISQPDRRVTELPLLKDEERHRLLVEWNTKSGPLPQSVCVHELFEQTVQRSPEALAVVFQRRALTYRELNTRANRLAHDLRNLGVGPEVRVGIYLERSPEAVVAVLAVLAAGGAYVPLDPTYPEDRVAFMIDDARLEVLLSRSSLANRLPPGVDATIVALDTIDDRLAAWPSDAPASGVTLDDLAYVLYTSGSTGRPKGVAITHRNLAASTTARLRAYDRPVERYLLVTSLAFDSSVAGIFWSLCQGGALVLPSEDFRHDPAQLVRLVAEERVTHLLCVPSLYRLLLELADPPDALASLHTVIVAGEACPPGLVARHHATLPHARLFNEYGPTEATVWCSVYETRPEDGAATNVAIGWPIAGARVYVLDPRRQPTPIGVPGELCIGGAGVARGYHRRPELTAERFIPDPFSSTPGARLYQTGDLARWRPDGSLEFLGRLDDQIKLRGYRIELGEIEAVLDEHPAVLTSAVACRDAGPTNQELVAYLVEDPASVAQFVAQGEPHAENSPELAAEPPEGERWERTVVPSVCAHLRRQLPEYMVPTAYVRLDALPVTPNGKVDRRALPAPARGAGTREQVDPRTDDETAIARIWAEVLCVERVGVHDNFFDLGGHSLLLARVHGQLGERFEPPPSMVDLFTYPTVASLARVLGARANGEHEPEQEAGDMQRRARRRREALAQRKLRVDGARHE